jgi:hypothetical protein
VSWDAVGESGMRRRLGGSGGRDETACSPASVQISSVCRSIRAVTPVNRGFINESELRDVEKGHHFLFERTP